jgi:FkbM family methyltransferase
MKGSFRDTAEREKQRESFRATVVPHLAQREVQPLLSFFPDQRNLTVLDIGANKGQWTRALLDVFGDRVARVHMFDPSPENYRELSNREDNLAGLGPEESERITVHPSAMGRTPGMATLYTNDDGSPLGSLYPHEENGYLSRPMTQIRLDTTIEVPVDTVDEFISRSEIASVDIMKMDTEGHEMEVLRGAARSIHVGKIKLILFEFGLHQIESRDFFKDFWQFLTRRLYKMYFVDNDGKIQPIPHYQYRWERFDSIYEFVAVRSTWLWPTPLQVGLRADMVERMPPAARAEPVPEAMGNGSVPRGANRTSTANGGSPGELLPSSPFMTRKEKVDFIRKIVQPERAKGLELGPDVNPVFRKSEGCRVKYLEATGTNALRERCIKTGIDPSKVETIDFILDRGKTLAEMVGSEAPFDYVLTSHVIEHIPNLVAHFNEVAEVLTERGCYALVVPDRNLCFDCTKPLSTLGHILESYVYGWQIASLASMIDEMRYSASCATPDALIPAEGGSGGWRYMPNQTVAPKYENRYRQITNIITRPEQQLAAWFGHQWRFSPRSFVSIMSDLNKLGLVGLHIEAIRPTGFMDFIVILRKGGEPAPLSELVAQIGDYKTAKVGANDPEFLLDQ